ncbi:TPA: DNA repair protein RecO [Neisseria meningitidis]|uniref:DNA repair protein RecO n=1 Tax=Neisseria meningitidis TaxID=487 RepID=UPI00027CBAD0|nr:DNA repair protein RecO [Neisseria meningitidis]EJU68557.1 DNA repair protein RecO [Neisseria meningitidis 98008]MBW3880511.1 DNA repair protein RecO [Neisseria meningitidis]
MSEHRINHEPVFLLASSPWRESSLRVEAFSRRYGRVALLARSARKRQSELRGVLVPFMPVSASWYGSQELKTLHRAEWVGGWRQPQGRALFSGLYVNELVLKLTAREDPMPELYDALAKVMEAVCREANHIADLRRFEWKLLNALGVAPDLHADGTGGDILADKTYRLMPEEAVMPVCRDTDALSHEAGAIVEGQSLIDLREGSFRTAESLQQALKITRLFIRHLLPEGLKSRQVLEQIRQFDRKETARETVPTSDGTASNAV